MTPLQSIFDGTASWQDLFAMGIAGGVALAALIVGVVSLLIRLRGWLAGGRTIVELSWEREDLPIPAPHPDVLPCHTCHQLYVARPSERTAPEYLCRACAVKVEAA